MQNPRLASRYAKSLIDLAIEKGQLEQVFADMQWLQAVCKSNRDFVNLLRSPIIKNEVKKKIITAVTTGKVGEMTAAFNNLLVTKNREKYLPEIVNAFITAYKTHKNIQTIHLTTAVPVSDTVKQSIVSQVKKSGGFQHVELEEKINPDIIGGFILQIGDKLVDASIAYDLKAIANQFKNNDFIYKIR
ncbi:MAG TPA: ATP synthase F1 subunit delta [Chitinophagaceae bacterium]|nr:ATP synthase F1 subunit delta [Chitinophagaceae bacterium]